VVFCLVCTASILTMELFSLLSPEAAGQRLDGLKEWLTTHRDEAIIALSLIIGLWLIGDSVYLIVS
jgi:fructose-specific phosphotransferase system IIC component